jgi:hypothetical protein
MYVLHIEVYRSCSHSSAVVIPGHMDGRDETNEMLPALLFSECTSKRARDMMHLFQCSVHIFVSYSRGNNVVL